jgi:membrane-associated phospholipid phosphatase
VSGLENGWGLQVVLWFQMWRGPLMESFAQIFNILGREDFFIVFIPFVYWSIDVLTGRRLLVMLMLSVWSNSAVKTLWNRPRPFQISTEVHNIITETSPGIPSGHVQNSTVLVSTLAAYVKRGWFTALMVLYIALMAVSRIVAGVHFPQDVIAGAAIALLIFALYLWLEKSVGLWLSRQNLALQIGFVIAAALVMALIHPLAIRNLETDSLDNVMTVFGVVVGGGIGFVLEARYLRFSAAGPATQRGLRLVIGIIIAMALRYGLAAAFEPLGVEPLFRFIRYCIIGFWMAYGAPRLFLRFNLAGHRDAPTTLILESSPAPTISG